MGLVTWMAASGYRPVAAIAASVVVFSVAYLSHFSTLSVGVPLLTVVGALLAFGGAAETRRLAAWVLAIAVIAAATSYVLYYSHFHSVYRATADRVLSGEGAAESRSMTAPIAVKAERWLWTTRLEFGVPALLLAAVGGVWMLRRPRSPAIFVLAAWAVTWLGFSVLGVATPVEMRASLAAAPVMLAMASFAIGSMAGRSTGLAAVAVVAALAIACDGFTRWIHCLTG